MDLRNFINRKISQIPVWLVYIIGFIPLIILFYRGYFNLLGVDPLKVLEHELGEFALKFLVIVLFLTPIRRLFKINLIRFRRCTGLLSFWYAFFHFLVYIMLDQQMNWALIVEDLLKRPYIIVGFLAFLLILPLAATSNNWSIRWLSLSTWIKMHKIVYLASIMAALHYILLVKSWPLEPMIYLALIIFLVVIRFVPKKYF